MKIHDFRPRLISTEKNDESENNETDDDDSNDGMKPFCCNICAQGFHCKSLYSITGPIKRPLRGLHDTSKGRVAAL